MMLFTRPTKASPLNAAKRQVRDDGGGGYLIGVSNQLSQSIKQGKRT